MPTTEVSTENVSPPATEDNGGLVISAIKIDNFMRILAADVSDLPDDLVVLAGLNGEGKTSFIRAVRSVLEGGKEYPDRPIHGENAKGSIAISLARAGMPEYELTLDFKRNRNPVFDVQRVDREPVKRKREVIDALINTYCFDPCKFVAKGVVEQREMVLQALNLGEKVTELAGRRDALFQERTDVNRDGKSKRGELAGMVIPQDVPEQRIDAATLVEEKNRRQAILDTNSDKCRQSDEADTDVVEAEMALEDASEAVGAARGALERAEDAKKDAVGALGAAEKNQKRLTNECSRLVAPDMDEVDAQIVDVDATNTRFDNAVRFNSVRKECETFEEQSAELTRQIGLIDTEKEQMLASAEFPVEGLGFTDEGVTFNGIPFDQIAGADQIRVSMALAMRLNPEVRVVLIDDASLMDKAHFEIIKQMARQEGFQLVAAIVGKQDDATYIIEDGMVRQPVSKTGAADA